MKPLFKLNLIQFFDAINENYTKTLIAFFLITLHANQNPGAILTKTSGLFLVPFLLFSNVGGILADKFSKSRVILFTRYAELFLLLAVSFSLFYDRTSILLTLIFLVATVSALFGPTKYSIIAEIHPISQILTANSLIAAYTFFGIILGTGLVSLSLEFLKNHFFLASFVPVFLVCFQIAFSHALPKTAPRSPERRLSVFVFREIGTSLAEMRKVPCLFATFLAYAYFLFLGSFLQLGVIDFTIGVLHLTPMAGGYLFLLSAVGIGIGSYSIPLFAKMKNTLLLIPLMGSAISLFFLCIGFAANIFLFAVLLMMTGIAGGIFLVPAQTFLQQKSPETSRGRNFGTANQFSFFFALLAPLLLWLLSTPSGASIKTVFVIVALMNALAMVYFFIALRKKRVGE